LELRVCGGPPSDRVGCFGRVAVSAVGEVDAPADLYVAFSVGWAFQGDGADRKLSGALDDDTHAPSAMRFVTFQVAEVPGQAFCAARICEPSRGEGNSGELTGTRGVYRYQGAQLFRRQSDELQSLGFNQSRSCGIACH